MLTIAAMMVIGISSGFASSTAECGQSLQAFEYSQIHMGVRVRIAMFAADEAAAERAATLGFQRFAELEAIMSDYRPDSEVSRLCVTGAMGPVRVSDDLFRVLQRSQEVAERSNGAFDVTCGPVIRLWRQARKDKRLPAEGDLARAREVVGFRALQIDTGARTVRLLREGMKVDLGGIAKGDACDQALRAVTLAGVERALIEAGGDIVASGPPPGKLGWRIRVQGAPHEEILLNSAAISTSGDAYQHVILDGKRYSHIVDPRTGWALKTSKQVSVLAADGLTTDGLATALCVLDERQGRALAERYGAQAYFAYPKGGDTKESKKKKSVACSGLG